MQGSAVCTGNGARMMASLRYPLAPDDPGMG